MPGELHDAWTTNCAITLMLLDAISDEGLRCTLSKRGGRDVAGQLAHLHNLRVWQLQKRARDLAEGLVPFDAKTNPSPGRAELRDALLASADAVATFLADLHDEVPKRRGFRKGLWTTLAYFVAHESHHRGAILLTLKTAGHPVDRETRDALWGGWDRIRG